METIVTLLKALADRNRLRIIAALLHHDELCGCQLTELLGVAGATASRHLSQLQNSGLVRGRKEGRWVYFRLSRDLPHDFPIDWLREHISGSRDMKKDLEHLDSILAQDPETICRMQRGESLAEERLRRDMAEKLLFLCTGNSCRSQMAEAWANHLLPQSFSANSAGIEAHGLNPLAVEVMREAGVDMGASRSKLVDEFDLNEFDVVITVCDHAHESCPMVPPRCRVIHQGFDDPPRLAKNMDSQEEVLACYRRVRDEIKAFVQTLPELAVEEKAV